VGGLNEHERDGVGYFGFESFEAHARLNAVVTTRHGGVSTGPYASLNLGGATGDDPQHVRENRKRAAWTIGKQPHHLVFAKQVHGSHVAHVPAGHDAGAFDDTDALVTNATQTPLVILTADCAAIFLYDPVHHAIGIAHAGWRGTVAGIAGETVAQMSEKFGSSPADIIAGIGPSIGPCCYEVGDEVIFAVEARLPDYTEEILVDPDMASAGSFRASVNEGRRHFDLWRANELVLNDAGVPEQNIEMARLCTSCRTDLFYSHRAEKGVTGRFGGILMLV
jgi:YfiH family protein